jgi:HTH-type transcriptional regulator/antitoxin HipB
MEYHIRTLDQLRPILVGLRKQLGLSQMAVASLLGVSQQSYAKIEANPATTSVERLFKILSLLGGEIILNERTPGTDRTQSPTMSDGEGNPPVPPQQGSGKGKNKPSAPEKLIPPSKKTENW